MDASVREALADAITRIERRRAGVRRTREPVPVYRGEEWSVPSNDHGWVELHDWQWSWPPGEDVPWVEILGTTLVTANGNRVALAPCDFPAQYITDVEDAICLRLQAALDEQAREFPSERDIDAERGEYEYQRRREEQE